MCLSFWRKGTCTIFDVHFGERHHLIAAEHHSFDSLNQTYLSPFMATTTLRSRYSSLKKYLSAHGDLLLIITDRYTGPLHRLNLNIKVIVVKTGWLQSMKRGVTRRTREMAVNALKIQPSRSQGLQILSGR